MDGKVIPTAKQQKALVSSLYEEYFDYLVDYAQANGFSYDVAVDLVQDTYVVALQKAVDLYRAPSRRAWLIVTLRNLSGNHQKNIMYAQKLQQILEANYSENSPTDLHPSVLYKNLIDAEDLDILIDLCEGLGSLQVNDDRVDLALLESLYAVCGFIIFFDCSIFDVACERITGCTELYADRFALEVVDRMHGILEVRAAAREQQCSHCSCGNTCSNFSHYGSISFPFFGVID